MQSYGVNKTLSIGVPLVVILGSFLLLGSNPKQWSLLLMIVFTLGYTHYIIGGYYQVRSFLRHDKSGLLIGAFMCCILFSAVLIGVAQAFGYMWMIAFLAIPYFMVHGYFNEITLFEKGSSYHVPRGLFLSISLFLTGLTMLAFVHPSAYFGYDLSFMSPLEIVLVQQIQNYTLVVGMFFATVLIFGAVGVTVGALFRKSLYPRAYQFLLVIQIGALGLLVYGPPNYTYLFFLLLSYHFITWALFYGKQFYSRSDTTFFWYVLQHLMIIALTLLGYWLFRWSEITNPTALVFNGNVFLFLTMIHITTSFLNDGWCKRMLGIT